MLPPLAASVSKFVNLLSFTSALTSDIYRTFCLSRFWRGNNNLRTMYTSFGIKILWV